MNVKTQNSKTTSELIADELRIAIVAGQYKTGQTLKQDELAKRYEVSKIPIREALYQLKTEGLVTFQNNRGSIVSSLRVSEVEEIYSMRIALEEIALKRALPKMQEADFISSETALKLIDASDNPLEWPTLNWQFHASLYKAANTPKLLETVEVLHNNVARYLVLYLAELDYQTTSQKEHWALLDACRQKNTKTALNILKKHLKDASTQTQQFIRKTKGN